MHGQEGGTLAHLCWSSFLVDEGTLAHLWYCDFSVIWAPTPTYASVFLLCFL